jgi:hypothetical protein
MRRHHSQHEDGDEIWIVRFRAVVNGDTQGLIQLAYVSETRAREFMVGYHDDLTLDSSRGGTRAQSNTEGLGDSLSP